LIDVASHAKNGIKIPGQKGTRVEIMLLFKITWEHEKPSQMYVSADLSFISHRSQGF